MQNLKLDSKLMARQMPYRVILPTDYDADKAQKYAVIYLLHGLTGHFDNWDESTKLKEYAAAYKYIFVQAEGDNGWYSDSATVPNDKYESYIVKELIPEIDKITARCPTKITAPSPDFRWAATVRSNSV